MKTIKSLATLTLCLLSGFGTSVVLNTQQAKAADACSNTSLDGAYEFQAGGYVNNTDPYALNSLLTFDGNGNVAGTNLVTSVAGDVTTNIGTQGTYQVNSDCSVTASFTRTDGTSANYSGVIYDNSIKFTFTRTDSGTIVNGKCK